MVRRTLTIVAWISLLLGVVLLDLAYRSRIGAEAWELRTSGRGYWQFSSDRYQSPVRVTLMHVGQWPEPPGTMHAEFGGPSGWRPHTLVTLEWLTPGCYTRETKLAGITVGRGRLATLIGPDGRVIRQPPWLHGDVLRYASAPLPYWIVSVPAWLAAAPFMLLPGIGFSRRADGRIISRTRRRRLLCESCGYDLRGSGDRCPECGGAPTRFKWTEEAID